MTARVGFSDDLEGLRLQVEVMALLVGEAVAAATASLRAPDPDEAARIIAGDDAIDEMHVSLVEHCYQLLAREAPVASDLRLIVSVIRVLHELERIGDLSLRVMHAIDDVPVIGRHPAVQAVLESLADNVSTRYRTVQEAWSAASAEPLAALEDAGPLTEFMDELVRQLLALDGDDAVRAALAAMVIGRAFDRIGDHTQIMASRLRYLLTGDPVYLADEVTW